MADEKNRPIEGAMVGATLPHGPPANDMPPTCVACGKYHGSVNVGRHCLELEVVRLRRILRARRPGSDP